MVNVVRDRFGCCTAGGETPVAEGAEGFAAALVRRVPPVELERPGVVAHRRPSLVAVAVSLLDNSTTGRRLRSFGLIPAGRCARPNASGDGARPNGHLASGFRSSEP